MPRTPVQSGRFGVSLISMHRIGEAHDLGERLADGRVFGEFDDAVVFLGEAHLAFGAQHAVRLDAADRRLLQFEAGAGDGDARMREDALHAGARVRGAADDLEFFLAGVDDADAQLVGVRVLFGRDDVGDGERREFLRLVFDGFDFEADVGQRVGDLVDAARRCRGDP